MWFLCLIYQLLCLIYQSWFATQTLYVVAGFFGFWCALGFVCVRFVVFFFFYIYGRRTFFWCLLLMWLTQHFETILNYNFTLVFLFLLSLLLIHLLLFSPWNAYPLECLLFGVLALLSERSCRLFLHIQVSYSLISANSSSQFIKCFSF